MPHVNVCMPRPTCTKQSPLQLQAAVTGAQTFHDITSLRPASHAGERIVQGAIRFQPRARAGRSGALCATNDTFIDAFLCLTTSAGTTLEAGYGACNVTATAYGPQLGTLSGLGGAVTSDDAGKSGKDADCLAARIPLPVRPARTCRPHLLSRHAARCFVSSVRLLCACRCGVCDLTGPHLYAAAG
jgi:hypothetical protein